MPTLGNHLDFAKLEGRNFRAHQLGTAPSTPVAGQMYFNTGDNTLYWFDGSIWVPAKDVGGGGAPTGAAGGDLSGSYPNPTIGVGKVTSSHILDATITDTDVAAANKDGATGTPSMRTLGLGTLQALQGTVKLNLIAAPTATLDFNNQKLASLANPSNPTDAANKQYVDGVAQGLDTKQSARAATDANITLSGTQTIDSVAVIANDRVLVKNQTTIANNGLYVVAAGAWTRATDMDAWAEVPGAFVFVEEGGQAESGWVCTADQGGTLGSTPIQWVQFSGAGQVIAGAGLSKSGNTLDVGAAAGISVNPDSIGVALNGITNGMLADGAVNLASADVTGALPVANGGTNATDARTGRANLSTAGYYTTLNDVAGASYVIAQVTHNLRASRGLVVQVNDGISGVVELPDIQIASSGDVTVTWAASQTANTKRITIVG